MVGSIARPGDSTQSRPGCVTTWQPQGARQSCLSLEGFQDTAVTCWPSSSALFHPLPNKVLGIFLLSENFPAYQLSHSGSLTQDVMLKLDLLHTLSLLPTENEQ